MWTRDLDHSVEGDTQGLKSRPELLNFGFSVGPAESKSRNDNSLIAMIVHCLVPCFSAPLAALPALCGSGQPTLSGMHLDLSVVCLGLVMLALLVAWLAALGVAKTVLHDLDLGEPFLSHDFHNQNYDIGGSAMLSRRFCRLTSDLPGQQGWISAQRALLPENFELEMAFEIYGAGRSMYGDGMALWFLQDDQPIEQGPVFGLSDHFKGTAIFIDTYRNYRPGHAFPYIMLMQNDGHQTYDADRDGRANELTGKSVRGLHTTEPRKTLIRVTYHKGGLLTVEINYQDNWETCFSLPFNLDGARRLAVSASTGQLSENHNILSIQVSELEDLSEQEKSRAQHQGYTEESAIERPRGRWLWSIIKLILLGVAVFGAFRFYQHYKIQRYRKSDLGHII